MLDRKRLRRLKNLAYVAVERSAFAIRRYQTAHNGPNGYEPLPAGWSERREQLAREYRAAVAALEVAR